MKVNKNKKIKEYIKSEYLSKKLIDKITQVIFNESSYEYRTKNNFLKCIGIIYNYQIKEYENKEIFVPLGNAYWRKVFGGDYHKKVLSPLLKLWIIERHDFGYRHYNSISKGKSKGLVGIRYRINPDLLNEEFDEMHYINKGRIVSAEEEIRNEGQPFKQELIPDKNFLVSIDHTRANKWIEENAQNICKEYLRVDYIKTLPDELIVKCREYLDTGSYNTQYSSIQSLKSIAQTKGKEFFFFKDSFYLSDMDEFLKHRTTGIIYHYKQEISKIGKVELVNNKSSVTLRLYNHLVNFPSKILKFIILDGKPIVQLDLRTSQLLLFSNILNVYLKDGRELLSGDFKQKPTQTYLKRLFKVLDNHKALLPSTGVDIHGNQLMYNTTSDVTKFIKDVFFNDFYEVLQNELKLPSRGLAKQLVFKLLFKRTNKPDKFLELLNQRYPVVMSIIAGFKDLGNSKNHKTVKDDLESNFSVFLQCVESEIFIDKILIPLREQNIPCFTRHDSVVVAEGYQKKVEDHIRKVFRDMDFRYNHSVEEKFWELADEESLENGGYLDWLIDENELKTDFDVEIGWSENESDEIDKDVYKEENEFENMTDEDDIDEANDNEPIHKLRMIGKLDNYYGFIDVDFLEELTQLPELSQQNKNMLFDDIENLHQGHTFLSDETNKLLRFLAMD